MPRNDLVRSIVRQERRSFSTARNCADAARAQRSRKDARAARRGARREEVRLRGPAALSRTGADNVKGVTSPRHTDRHERERDIDGDRKDRTSWFRSAH